MGSSSRLTPQHRFWHEDLPERTAFPIGKMFIGDDLNAIDDVYLEVARISNQIRGGSLLVILLVLGLSPVLFLVLFGGDGFADNVEQAGVVPILILAISMIGLYLATIWLSRYDLSFAARSADTI